MDVVPAYAPEDPELPDELTFAPPDALPDELAPEDALPPDEPDPEDALPPDELAEADPPPDELPELFPDEPEPPPRSIVVLPAPVSSTSSEPLLPEPDVSSLKSTLVLPTVEEEESESSSLLPDELPPSRLENT